MPMPAPPENIRSCLTQEMCCTRHSQTSSVVDILRPDHDASRGRCDRVVTLQDLAGVDVVGVVGGEGRRRRGWRWNELSRVGGRSW